ncbi:hypothetical protein BC833DRAFT_602948 [Globomyces pollinis-pini]|nr:hypothetical protein BC833DRAFT_602948 [Globomyces pollinis-pini]
MIIFKRYSHSQTRIEKIIQKFTKSVNVSQGDFISITPHRVMTHDNTAAVMQKFSSIGAPKFHNPNQVVFTLDHDVQNKSEANIRKYSNIESFAKLHRVDFYPAGRGIGHQIMVEEGYAFPNTLAVASDSHSNMYGGIGCLGTPIVRTDAAAIWATGRTWWQIPSVVRVALLNKPALGVTGKDIIVSLCALFSDDQVLNCAVEFVGNGIQHLSIDDRLTIANMTTEWGALAGVFPVDNHTIQWLKDRKQKLKTFYPTGHDRINTYSIDKLIQNPIEADENAFYAKTLTLDLSTVSPYISGPNSVKIATPAMELESKKIKIDKAYLVSCTNSRASDIIEAANALQGKKVAPGVEFYIAAASSEVQNDVELSGHWGTLLAAGAKPLPAGCGPCIGLGTGLLEDGQVGISATNRNYKGRMGSPKALAYLASPAVVACSAVSGYIRAPPNTQPQSKPITTFEIHTPPELKSTKPTETVAGFDPLLTGELLFCDADNLNTDGIYPGKYTYQDDLTPEQMALVAMENYDPNFVNIRKKVIPTFLTIERYFGGRV